MEILEQLKEELGRLYIAGSKNAVNDPRLKKYIPVLEKLGEKSKVFVVLKEGLVDLVDGSIEESESNISKVFTLINAVVTTQSNFSCKPEELEEIVESEKVYKNLLSNKEINNYFDYIKEIENFRDVVDDIINTINNDFRLYRYAGEYIGKSYQEQHLVAMIYRLDENFGLYLLDNFDYANTVVNNRKLKYIFEILKNNEKVMKERVLPLAKKIIEDKLVKVIPSAIETLGYDIENEALVLEFFKKKKAEYRVSGLAALYTMGSEQLTTVLNTLKEKESLYDLFQLIRDAGITLGRGNTEKEEFLEEAMLVILDKCIDFIENGKEDRFYTTTVLGIHRLLANLSYDKFNVFYRVLFSQNWILNHKETYDIYYTMGIYQLIENDIRYNEFLYDIISKKLEIDENGVPRKEFYLEEGELNYFYLVVIKNLFDEEKVNRLSKGFLQFTEKTDVIIRAYTDLDYQLRVEHAIEYYGTKIEINDNREKNIFRQRNLYYEKVKKPLMQNMNLDIINYLFEKTYYFQCVLGKINQTSGDGIPDLIEYYLENNPEKSKMFFEKLEDFILNKLVNIKKHGNTSPFSDYKTENILRFDNEEFAKVFFRTALCLREILDNNVEFEYQEKYFKYYRLKYGSEASNFKKYKYLLEDKEFEKIREYFNQSDF